MKHWASRGLLTALGLICCCAGSAPAAPPDAARIGIVAGPQTTYRQAADAAEQALREAGHTCIRYVLPIGNNQQAMAKLAGQLRESGVDVLACAGSDASLLALQATPDTPVVAFMIPNALDAPFLADDYALRSRVAAVAADPAPEQLIDWIIDLTPDHDHVGVLHSERTQRTVSALRSAGARRGITVTAIDASKDAFPEAVEALTQQACDGVLMIPDAAVYNAPNVKRLLLWGLRQERAVWGFSDSIVKAGALAGQFPDEASVARETTQLIERILAGAQPGELPVSYVAEPQRAVNLRTAEMIRVRLREWAIGPHTIRMGGD